VWCVGVQVWVYRCGCGLGVVLLECVGFGIGVVLFCSVKSVIFVFVHVCVWMVKCLYVSRCDYAYTGICFRTFRLPTLRISSIRNGTVLTTLTSVSFAILSNV